MPDWVNEHLEEMKNKPHFTITSLAPNPNEKRPRISVAHSDHAHVVRIIDGKDNAIEFDYSDIEWVVNAIKNRV